MLSLTKDMGRWNWREETLGDADTTTASQVEPCLGKHPSPPSP